MKILLIEDDIPTSLAISEALRVEKYGVDRADNGQMGLELAQAFPYDLILLDIMLPRLDGISVCRRLRDCQNHTPILVLTAKDNPQDCVVGLEAGADDYLVKPFDWAELLARIHAISRRGKNILPDLLSWENLEVNLKTHQVTYQGDALNLTPTEYSLLTLFLKNPERIFSRQAIIDWIWPSDKVPGEETVNSHIKTLRQKLKAVGMSQDIIKTVYGFGYRLQKTKECLGESQSLKQPDPNIQENLQPEKEKIEKSGSLVSQSSDTSVLQTETKQQVQTQVAQIWERMKGDLEKDVETLIQFIINLASAKENKVTQTQQAIALAHRLAGTLGIFGKTQASEIIGQIEALLSDKPHSQKDISQQLLDLVKSLQEIWQPNPHTSSYSTVKENPYLLCIGVAEKWIQSLKTFPSLQTWHIKAVSNLKDAQSILTNVEPNALVIDLELTQIRKEGLTLLSQLGQNKANFSFIALDTQHDLSYRLEIARLNKGLFLRKPITNERLLRAVVKVLQPNQTQDVTLMLMDDDPKFLAALKAILTPWGFNVVSLSNPQDFWQVLEETIPDLLILDINMPHFNGLDLCQVVRNDDRFCSLPIFVLSGEYNCESICQVFAHGADDYFLKPIVPEELISRIFQRLERMRNVSN